MFLRDLKLRLQKFSLELNSTKTRLIEFGRFAIERRKERGLGKPETFNFLGFTHICSKTRKGRFKIIRNTIKKKLIAKLKEIKIQLRYHLHDPIEEVGKWLRTVVQGHINYFAVPGNYDAISTFRYGVSRIWFRILLKRSDKRRINWERMTKIVDSWLPRLQIIHPYPIERFARYYPK